MIRTAVLCCALILAPTACGSTGAAAPAARSEIGVLATSCAPDRVAAQVRAGVRLAVLDIAWDRYEPRPGAVDPAYAEQVRRQVTACETAGISLVIGPGLQYPPGWVLGLDSGTYRNRAGETPDPPVANLVFSRAVRDAAGGYLARLDSDLGLRRFRAVRIGTTRTGELGYPGPGSAAFWAFDDAAQGGSGRADGVLAPPLPGWAPGEPTWRGVPVTPDQARGWFRWYADSAGGALAWQVDVLRGLGFVGDIHVPVAGRGVLPADLTAAVASRLGRVDPDGALGRGLDYPAQFAALARVDAAYPGRLAVAFTGLDDVSAVRARRLVPPEDVCRSDDVEAVRTGTDAVARWPAQRWTTASARLAGLGLVGENPGGPDLAHTGGAPDSDGVAAQLRRAPRYAQECGLTEFYWAFEDTLYAPGSGVRLDDLARWVGPNGEWS